MNLSNIVFTDNLPKLDLHGVTKDIARVMVNDFINDNFKQKNEFFLIVHGIGSGILKNEVLTTLKNNKNVIDYKILYNNIGCTIVQINIEKV